MGMKHSTTKASGESGYAIEWNAEHIIDSDIDFGGFSGINVGEPINASDIATKNYVDVQAKAMVGGRTNTTLSGTKYMYVFGNVESCSSNETYMRIPVPYNCVIKNLYLYVTMSPGNITLTLMKNGGATSLTTSKSGIGLSSKTYEVICNAGDVISLQVVLPSGTPSTKIFGWGMEIDSI